MYITHAQLDALENAIDLLPIGIDKASLDAETQDVITKAQNTLVELRAAQKAANKQVAAYIKERRKIDKSYAR